MLRRDQPALRQAYLLLCSTAQDVLSKPGFYGRVTIDLFVQDGKFTGLEKNIKQTIKVD